MRYRPFGRSGVSVSVLTLKLGARLLEQGPDVVRQTLFGALETGVNSFHLENADPVLAELVGEALASVDRRLVSVSLAIGEGGGRRSAGRDFSADTLTREIESVLHVSGLGWLDLVVLDKPGDDNLPQAALNALKAHRSAGRVKQLGVGGEALAMDAYISTGAFDVLFVDYNIDSPWTTRSRIRAAIERDMGVIGCNYFPASLDSAKKASATDGKKGGLFSLFAPKPRPLGSGGTYAFLYQTPMWSAEEICLAAVLTDPSIASVVFDADRIERIKTLAETPERDMPPGLSAQIEMARVGSARAA